jgi:hypothetical protein
VSLTVSATKDARTRPRGRSDGCTDAAGERGVLAAQSIVDRRRTQTFAFERCYFFTPIFQARLCCSGPRVARPRALRPPALPASARRPPHRAADLLAPARERLAWLDPHACPNDEFRAGLGLRSKMEAFERRAPPPRWGLRATLPERWRSSDARSRPWRPSSDARSGLEARPATLAGGPGVRQGPSSDATLGNGRPSSDARSKRWSPSSDARSGAGAPSSTRRRARSSSCAASRPPLEGPHDSRLGRRPPCSRRAAGLSRRPPLGLDDGLESAAWRPEAPREDIPPRRPWSSAPGSLSRARIAAWSAPQPCRRA